MLTDSGVAIKHQGMCKVSVNWAPFSFKHLHQLKCLEWPQMPLLWRPADEWNDISMTNAIVMFYLWLMCYTQVSLSVETMSLNSGKTHGRWPSSETCNNIRLPFPLLRNHSAAHLWCKWLPVRTQRRDTGTTCGFPQYTRIINPIYRENYLTHVF